MKRGFFVVSNGAVALDIVQTQNESVEIFLRAVIGANVHVEPVEFLVWIRVSEPFLLWIFRTVVTIPHVRIED